MEKLVCCIWPILNVQEQWSTTKQRPGTSSISDCLGRNSANTKHDAKVFLVSNSRLNIKMDIWVCVCTLHSEQIKGHATDPKPQPSCLKFCPERRPSRSRRWKKAVEVWKGHWVGVIPSSRQSTFYRLLLWSIVHHCWKAWLPLVRGVWSLAQQLRKNK